MCLGTGPDRGGGGLPSIGRLAGEMDVGRRARSIENPERPRVPAAELATAGARIFAAAGSSPEEATLIADHLVEANLVGHDSHGVIRIKKYIDWARAGQVLPNRHVDVVTERGAALLLDGGFG